MPHQTPEYIAQFGHIIIALRKYLEEKDMSVSDLNRAMGYDSGHATMYRILNGHIAPSPIVLTKLSKVTGLELIPKEITAVAVIPKGPVGKMLDQLQRNDILSFTVNNHGEAKIKFEITLPVNEAMPLLRILMDTGVVPK